MFVIFSTMNFHEKALPSRSHVPLPKRWVHGFDVLGIASVLLGLALEVTLKIFQLAAVIVLFSLLTFIQVLMHLALGSGIC